jgi:malonyl-CoA/methylmalonyl-CoA synthetase
MAVPTIYHRLIEMWETADQEERQRFVSGCTRLRLMVSGSAALPVPVLERWREISGHTLLERYGMTEIGMALSNPLVGERRPGRVGSPLPGVSVRLVDEEGSEVIDGEPGQIEVKGDSVFREYWRRPQATREAFTDDGWFRTGDVATSEAGVYRLLGRASVDIIKSGGEKVSALEIEEALMAHEAVSEAAVVGLPDVEWGQRIVAAIVPKEPWVVSTEDLHQWCRSLLAPYKVPKQIHFLDGLPRNSLGKVTKPELINQLTNAKDQMNPKSASEPFGTGG